MDGAPADPTRRGEPKVAAVLVSYNTRELLLDALRSLRADGVEDIVVVDNASTDGSARAVPLHDPEVTVLENPRNLGFAAAANRGIAGCAAPYVLLLNPDARVSPGTVGALADALDEDPGLAVVGPRIENPDGTRYPSVRRFPGLLTAVGHAFGWFVDPANRFTRRYRMVDWDATAPADVDWVSGTCALVRQAAFRAVGGFDERYFMYVEDVDLCRRLWDAGWRVGYRPVGPVVHVVGAASELAPYRMIVEHHRSLYRYAARHAGPRTRALLPLVAAGLVVRTVLSCVQRRVRGRAPAAV